MKNKIDPFKVQKIKSEKKEINAVSAPKKVAKAIDEFRKNQEQARHFDGIATIYKDEILEYGRTEFAKRAINGHVDSFKIVGNESMVTFITQDSTARLSEDDRTGIAEKWGTSVADELITKDYGTLRFDPRVLEAHYAEVVAALQTLSPDIIQALFKPMALRGIPGVVGHLTEHAKTPHDLIDLMFDLKIKHYIS